MAALTQARIDELKALLEARHAALREEIQEQMKRTSVEAVSEQDDLDKLDGDAAAAAANAEMNAAMMSRDVVEVRDIEEALDRIQQGSYGECVDCGVEIRFARLRAFPTARRCIDCQSKLEDGRDTSGPRSL